MTFGGAPCGEISASVLGSYTLSCNLDYAPYGGDHNVKLHDEFGIVSRTRVTAITVPVTVNKISPAS